ncbi:ABC-F family ATP-binding cassette domain-containing protein [Schaalia sp. ZJ405]|uniref:ATP-binding cassette domain-containing protein n=1 Tax=Schaalia sp. ZJ405 TaxID=2709403 RepID=UPI0013EB90D7|nr:ATP-binding cassette domain-containing protein [Schaalia sp. ZJ405]QPK81783.1 ABC-F family ATP-binding cassette domain-containing protein [Schaalia sp. ZJ405]
MSSLHFSHVSFSYPSVDVLTDISFTCQTGQRLALIGPNGSGKTTLLRLARGELTPLSGTIEAESSSPAIDSHLHSHREPGSLHTSASSGTRTLLDAPPTRLPTTTIAERISYAVAPLRALEQRFEEVSAVLVNHAGDAVREYDDLLTRMTTLNVWGLDARIDEVIAGMGLQHVEHSRPLNTLSPGQEARLELALTLVTHEDVLILDEPTNHLDDDAREFLIRTLIDWEGSVLFTSHDRDFIERVATGILDLDVTPWEALATAQSSEAIGGIYQSPASYAHYHAAKNEARAQHVALHEAQRQRKGALTEHVEKSQVVGHAHFTPRTEIRMAQKFYADRAQTGSTRRINNDAIRLERLHATEVRKPRYDELNMRIPASGTVSPLARAGHILTSGTIALSVRDASIPGRLKPVSFEARAGEHVLLTGPNGCGKSTVLAWLDAASHTPGAVLTPDASGLVVVAPGAAYVPQRLPHPTDFLVSDGLWDRGVGERGKGFLHPKFWTTSIGELSDGNQRRVQLALAATLGAPILLIDEPTNYLDVDAIESLESGVSGQNVLVV